MGKRGVEGRGVEVGEKVGKACSENFGKRDFCKGVENCLE